MTVLVSIVTAHLNSDGTLERYFESLLAQTSDNFEVIIADGLSGQSSIRLISDYGVRLEDRGIRLQLTSEQDSGIYDGMEKGAGLAIGQYLLFLNADDCLANPDVIKNFELAIERRGQSDVFVGGLVSVSPDKSVVNLISQEDLDHNFDPSSVVPHPSTFIKKDVFVQVGYRLNLKYAGDLALFWDLKKAGYQFTALEFTVSIFFIGGVSTDGKKGLLIFCEYWALYKAGYPLTKQWLFGQFIYRMFKYFKVIIR